MRKASYTRPGGKMCSSQPSDTENNLLLGTLMDAERLGVGDKTPIADITSLAPKTTEE